MAKRKLGDKRRNLLGVTHAFLCMPSVYDGPMEPTRRELIGGAIGALGATQLFGQRTADDRPKAPADVKPGSITYEDVAYPHPVQFLPLTLYGQDVKLA